MYGASAAPLVPFTSLPAVTTASPAASHDRANVPWSVLVSAGLGVGVSLPPGLLAAAESAQQALGGPPGMRLLLDADAVTFATGHPRCSVAMAIAEALAWPAPP
jgi:hypothetical protein